VDDPNRKYIKMVDNLAYWSKPGDATHTVLMVYADGSLLVRPLGDKDGSIFIDGETGEKK
jgi:hypothetical protein